MKVNETLIYKILGFESRGFNASSVPLQKTFFDHLLNLYFFSLISQPTPFKPPTISKLLYYGTLKPLYPD